MEVSANISIQEEAANIPVDLVPVPTKLDVDSDTPQDSVMSGKTKDSAPVEIIVVSVTH